MILSLYRTAQGAGGTFGTLNIGSEPLCVTCEDDWKNNQPNISCIPRGFYHCIPHSGPKFKDVWEVTNVPGRSAILIHAGNTIKDTEGCILVGNGFNLFGQQPGIINSQDTLQKLRKRLPKEFDLRIYDVFGGVVYGA